MVIFTSEEHAVSVCAEGNVHNLDEAFVVGMLLMEMIYSHSTIEYRKSLRGKDVGVREFFEIYRKGGGGALGRWVGGFDASNVALLGNSRGTGSCLSNGLISDCA